LAVCRLAFEGQEGDYDGEASGVGLKEAAGARRASETDRQDDRSWSDKVSMTTDVESISDAG
jgi:hypothetical protein